MRISDLAKAYVMSEDEIRNAIAEYKSVSFNADISLENDGTVKVYAPGTRVTLGRFIKHGRLAVKLSSVKAVDVSLDNLLDLHGLPESLDANLTVNSSSITDFKSFPSLINGSLLLSCGNLKTLQGFPDVLGNVFFNASCPISSFDGFQYSNLSGSVDFAALNNITTTDGLGEVTCKLMLLPISITQVTEIPKRCEHIRAPLVKGVTRCMLTPGLAELSLKLGKQQASLKKYDIFLNRVTTIEGALNRIIKELPHPKARFYEAEQVMIDLDAEEFNV